jgi:hypothetical protein
VALLALGMHVVKLDLQALVSFGRLQARITCTKSRPFGQVEANGKQAWYGSATRTRLLLDHGLVASTRERDAFCSLYAGGLLPQGVESESIERAVKSSVQKISCLREVGFSDRPEWHQSRLFDSRRMRMIMPPSSKTGPGLHEG